MRILMRIDTGERGFDRGGVAALFVFSLLSFVFWLCCILGAATVWQWVR